MVILVENMSKFRVAITMNIMGRRKRDLQKSLWHYGIDSCQIHTCSTLLQGKEKCLLLNILMIIGFSGIYFLQYTNN